MRYFVNPLVDSHSGRTIPGGLARIDGNGLVHVFDVARAEWVTASGPVSAQITARRDWTQLADADVAEVGRALIASQRAVAPTVDQAVPPRPEQYPTQPQRQRFDIPVQLKCIQSPDKTLLRFVPVLIVLGLCVLILAGIAFSLLMQSNLDLATLLAVAVAVATPVLMYVRRRARLKHEYAHQKRLTLSPTGLHRVDGNTDVRIPWSGVRGIVVTNDLDVGGANIPVAGLAGGVVHAAGAVARSGRAQAICGAGVVAPVPGASKRTLKVLDLSTGSRLRFGESSPAPMGIVFPGEFEQNWQHGIIGSWIGHYRPDIALD